MKRDMDLIRGLMLKLEALPMRMGGIVVFEPGTEEIKVDGYSPEEVFYHLGLIKDACLINSAGSGRMGRIQFTGLTWAGHDFLDSVRSADVWDKTKAAAAKVGGFTVDILVASAKAYVQQKFTELLRGQH